MARRGQDTTTDKLVQLQTPNLINNQLIDIGRSAWVPLSTKHAKEVHGLTKGEIRVVIGG